jgi:hypothetical protein
LITFCLFSGQAGALGQIPNDSVDRQDSSTAGDSISIGDTAAEIMPSLPLRHSSSLNLSLGVKGGLGISWFSGNHADDMTDKPGSMDYPDYFFYPSIYCEIGIL